MGMYLINIATLLLIANSATTTCSI